MYGRGNSKTTSTSKIKKITANIKNRKENGTRADLLGSNPHSKGVLTSRTFSKRIEITKNSPINKIGTNTANIITGATFDILLLLS